MSYIGELDVSHRIGAALEILRMRYRLALDWLVDSVIPCGWANFNSLLAERNALSTRPVSS